MRARSGRNSRRAAARLPRDLSLCCVSENLWPNPHLRAKFSPLSSWRRLTASSLRTWRGPGARGRGGAGARCGVGCGCDRDVYSGVMSARARSVCIERGGTGCGRVCADGDCDTVDQRLASYTQAPRFDGL